MKPIRSFFLKNNNKIDQKNNLNFLTDKYGEIGKIVKEARIKNNISIEDLSQISKIPKYLLESIENNNEKNRPKYPFIRSILLKLEDCLYLKKGKLIDLLIKEKRNIKKEKNKFLVSKFDFINSWEGSVFYFLILVLSILILKKFFFSNTDVIQIQNMEEQKNRK
tara:strand:+ start:11 stop:505 length:495 start_codon:yes stop_codon:yes gene_type:complete